MRMNQISNARNRHSVNLKKRIAKNRRRAKLVGLLYLLGTIALTALACLPLISGEVSFLGTKKTLLVGLESALTVFDSLENATATATDFVVVVCAFLYLAMLLGLVFNVLRSLGKLKWLFKKKASRTYGFNRNVYAMSMMGDRFAGTIGSIITFHFIMCLLCGNAVIDTMFLVAIGAGAAIHFLCGLLGGKTKLFHIEVGYGITEQERDSSRFVPFIRSLLQVASSFALVYLFMEFTTLATVLPAFFTSEGIINVDMFNSLDIMALISVFVQIVLAMSIISMVKRALTPVEFGIEGRFGEGIKKFRRGAFFTGLFAIAIYVCRTMFGEVIFTVDSVVSHEVQIIENTDILVIAGIALAMFIVELLLRKRPRTSAEKLEKAEAAEAAEVAAAASKNGAVMDENLSDDVDVDFYFNNCVMYPGIYYSGYEANNGYRSYKR